MSNPTGKLLDLMKHAVGLDHGKPKRGKYETYRNYFTAAKNDSLWEILCEDGYAFRGDCGEYQTYHVSNKGLDFLETVIDAKIIDYDNVSRWGRVCGNCRFHSERSDTIPPKHICIYFQSNYCTCNTKKTTKCHLHKFKAGLAYGGFIPANIPGSVTPDEMRGNALMKEEGKRDEV